MTNFDIATVGLAHIAAAASFGGGLYEAGIVDRAWPARPEIVSPSHGGINRKWFWIPMHVLFELALIGSLILAWTLPGVRAWLLLALTSHGLMRVWSFLYFVPRALRFEAMDPSAIDKGQTLKWVYWSRLRLLLDLITCVSTLAALIALVRLS